MEQVPGDVDVTRDDAAFIVGEVLDDLVCGDVDLNRLTVRRAVRMADAVALARRNVHVYVPGDPSVPGSVESAERAAVFDIALRLQSSEEQVQAEVFVVEQAAAHLPGLFVLAREGFVPWRLLARAVGALARVRAPLGASEEALAAQAEAFEIIDRATAGWVTEIAPGTFLRRLRALISRLDPATPEERHTRSLMDRRVVVEHVEGGMSWMHALVSTEKALQIKRSLTSQAKHLQKNQAETRTRDQLRADLLADRLTGAGMPNAARAEIFITIPMDVFAAAQGEPGEDADAAYTAASEGSNSPRVTPTPEIVGHGPIDRLTAAQLLLDTGAFRRVLTDPFTGAVVDMERTRRTATDAQRAWLTLQHGTCARDGCERLAIDADIDHEHPWATGGKTNLDQLRPLCPQDHAHRHRTRMRYRSRPDRTVEVATPTGHTTGTHRRRPATTAGTDRPPF